MIANVQPTAAKTVPGAAAPGSSSLLGLDFALLLAPEARGGAPAEPRQETAGGGKDLPDDTTPDDAWLALIGATVVPAPPPAGTPTVQAATPVAPTTPAAAPMIAATVPPTVPLVRDPIAGASPALPMSVTAATQPSPPLAARTSLLDTATTPATMRRDDRIALLALGTTAAREPAQPIPSPNASLTPAAQVVAVMAERPPPLLQGLTAIIRDTPVLPRASERERSGELRPDGSIQLPLVAAAIEPHRTMLDLRQEHWPQKMIEHIETLRDAADANDTRIRLVPDALGTVEVKLRRDGDAVHVAFAAERAETRALLDQAQPKLAELGEARGLRFANAGADTGGQTPQRQPAAPRLPTAPALAPDQPPADDADDTRIA